MFGAEKGANFQGEHKVNFKWTFFEPIFALPQFGRSKRFGTFLELFWNFFGTFCELWVNCSLKVHSKFTLSSNPKFRAWNFFGTFFELFWNFFGTCDAGPEFRDWNFFGTFLELFWNFFISAWRAVTFGTFLELFWNFLWTSGVPVPLWTARPWSGTFASVPAVLPSGSMDPWHRMPNACTIEKFPGRALLSALTSLHHIGTCLELFLNLELFWNLFGTFLELFLNLELFWNFFGTFLELFWNFFGTLELFWNFFGTFCELLASDPSKQCKTTQKHPFRISLKFRSLRGGGSGGQARKWFLAAWLLEGCFCCTGALELCYAWPRKRGSERALELCYAWPRKRGSERDGR